MTYLRIIFSLLALTQQSMGAVEAAQLDYVALDASAECNRILFQSSQHFKQTLFVIPRVVPGTGVENARTYNIIPANKPGYYTLAINLYFPASDEVIKGSAASTYKQDLNACNWDKVKNSVNKNITDPEQKIKTISRIPLTSIEVKIPGIQNIGLVGKTLAQNDEADILDYYGNSLTAYFQITETEKKQFQTQLVSLEGIKASIKFRFQARSRNGSVVAKINLETLSQNISVAASIKGLKYLGSADIQGLLKTAVANKSIQITSESGSNSGSNDEISKVTGLIFDKVMKEIGLSLENMKISDEDKAKAGNGQISVAALIQVLKNKMNSEISFNLVSGLEKASAQTELKLRTDRLNDPNIIEMILSAGYTDPSLGVAVNAGESITLTPAYWYLDRIEYKEVRNYLTVSDLQSLNLSSNFDDLTNKRISIENIDVNGTLLAEGQWRPFEDSTYLASPNRFRWARIQKIANRLRDSSNVIPSTLEALSSLPMAVTFSELGDRKAFKLSELLEENQFWKATYESLTGRLILTAKQNLGTIRFREKMSSKEDIQISKDPIILDQIFQQKINYFGESQYTRNSILKKDMRPLILQKSIVLYVTRPRVMTSFELKHLKPILTPANDLNQPPSLK